MIVPMTPEHCLSVARAMREDDRLDVFPLRWTDDADEFAASRVAAPGAAWAVLLPDGRPAVVGGVEVMTPARCCLWMIGTDEWRRVMVSVTRFVMREVVPRALVEFESVVALVRSGNERARKWICALHFVFEGTHRRLGRGGVDYLQYARVRA